MMCRESVLLNRFDELTAGRFLAAAFLVTCFLNVGGVAAGTLPDESLSASAGFPVGANPKDLVWEQVASEAHWGPRDAHAAVVYKDKLWLMGGINGDAAVKHQGLVEYWKAPHKSDVWVSDDGDNWRLVTDKAPWGGRRSIQVVVFQDRLWLMGGWGPEVGYRNDIWSSEDGVNWRLEIEHAGWSAREGHEVLVYGGKLWLIGGVRYDLRVTKNDVWSSEDGVSWTEVTASAPWRTRWDHGAAVFHDKLWLIGGMDLEGRTFGDVWSSENGADWELVTDRPPFASRQGHVVLEYVNRLWLVGRLNDGIGGGANDIWYSSDGYLWEKAENDPRWLGREDHAAVVFNGDIFMLGGMDSNWKWSGEVWRSAVSVPQTNEDHGSEYREPDAKTVRLWGESGGINKTFGLGASGDEVLFLQKVLSHGVAAKGYFDEKTKAELMRFQKYYGFSPTGTFDGATRSKINNLYLQWLCPNPSEIYPDMMAVSVTKLWGLGRDYVPPDLKVVPRDRVKTNGIICLRSMVVPYLELMVKDARRDGVILGITSGYRKPEIQGLLYDLWTALDPRSAENQIAEPLQSEHQLGTAVDFTGASINYAGVSPDFGLTKEGKWLEKNANRYGFLMSYPKGKIEVTGYDHEPWHFRFVGPAAKEIRLANATYEEYLASEKEWPELKSGAKGVVISADSFSASYFDPQGAPRLLVTKNPEARLPIASITKLMTALIARETYDVNQIISVRDEDLAGKGGSGKLKPNESFYLMHLINMSLVESNNDAARVLAGHSAGHDFLDKMNAAVSRLGLKDTHFFNASGVDGASQSETNYSTAADLTNMLAHLLVSNEDILKITARKETKIYSADGALHHTAVNTNRLLESGSIPLEIVGGKTGETPLARQDLVLVVRASNGGYLINVVLGSSDRFRDMAALVNWANESYNW